MTSPPALLSVVDTEFSAHHLHPMPIMEMHVKDCTITTGSGACPVEQLQRPGLFPTIDFHTFSSPSVSVFVRMTAGTGTPLYGILRCTTFSLSTLRCSLCSRPSNTVSTSTCLKRGFWTKGEMEGKNDGKKEGERGRGGGGRMKQSPSSSSYLPLTSFPFLSVSGWKTASTTMHLLLATESKLHY